MMRPCRLAAIATISVAACASTELPDLTPDVDPTMPGVEAPDDPSRAEVKMPDAPDAPDAGSTPAPESPDATPPPPASSADAGGPPPTVTPSTPKPTPGQVLITEIMYDPFGAEPDSEWFELHNTTGSALSLGGLVIEDGGGRKHTIAANATIAAGAYVVFARSKSAAVGSKVPAAAIGYEYGESLPANAGVLLANGSTGGLLLQSSGTVITKADYGGWFSTSGGSSIQLEVLSATGSASKTSWCVSATAWATGAGKGTPGAADDCP